MFNALFFKTFITLVETGSFTQTARKLGMTQPGVSQHVRKLEDYFSLPLLDRKGKRFELTEAGRQVYDYALRLFAEHEQFRHTLEQEMVEGGECRFASVETFGMLFYPFALGYLKNHPRLRLHFTFADNQQAVEWVQARKIDLALVSSQQQHPHLICEPYLQESLVVIVPADFQGNSFQELLSLGFIGHQEGQEHASKLLKANFPHEFKGFHQLTERSHVNQVQLVLDTVARGLGFSVLPRSVWEASPWQQQTREWHLAEEVSWPVYTVRRAKEQLAERYQHLLDEYLHWRQVSSSRPDN
ncbi:transcriptional regulator, LysR family [Marinospirillum celere]|uniref:Transcriptional regulator, LysR family n=1 Tax=Marinospirillum celere TaxID=1122252 RepID=A0A1I1GKS9_9GAMM|nr:LysR family transcriptional regulator [Marinospirillum celere]SFC12164.1 transcriptional regulator, LysR family [Marinospirillum celere]